MEISLSDLKDLLSVKQENKYTSCDCCPKQLETLREVTEIGGFEVVRDKPDNMSWNEFDEWRKNEPILLSDWGET